MGCLKCLKASTVPLALFVVIFYIVALVTHSWTKCESWKYNNGLWQKCTNDKCTRLYEANVQYRYRDSNCKGKADSYYTTDSNCKNYYSCLNGNYTTYTCSGSTQFNVGSQKCQSSTPPSCIDQRCVGKTNNQWYRTDTVCKDYYKCVTNAYQSGSCATNEYFNLGTGLCTSIKQTGCQDPKCRGVANGWYLTDSPTCKKYYICSNGFLTDNQQCTFASHVANPTTKTCTNIAPSTCKDPRCYNKAGDQYFVKSNLCTAWYRCNSGMYTEGTCPTNQYFDVTSKQCTATRPTTCVDYRCKTHGMSSFDGVTSNLCTEYYTCVSGKYTKTACTTSPAQTYYNSGTNLCTTTVPGTCKNPKCNNKADGWYITDSPTCKNYYVCHSGGLLTDAQVCSGNTVANTATKTCSGSANPTTCKDPRCTGKADGYYTFDSWCKNYYQCTGGLYTTGTCTAAQYMDVANKQCSATKPATCYDERCKTPGYNSGYRTKDNTCKAWTRCNSGTYTEGTCTNANEQFNVGTATCVTTTPTGCRDSRCDGKNDGYYVTDTTCRSWYKCMSGIYSTGTCTVNNVFVISSDQQSGSCRGTTNSGTTTCKDPRCLSLTNGNGNAYRDKTSAMCRNYYTCASYFYTDRSCAAFQYWDNTNAACTSSVPTGCRDQRCYGKSDGKYRLDTNCVSYYTCTSAKQVGAMATCTGGTKFQQITGTCVSTASPVGCKVDGAYGVWALWGACSVTKAFGTKARTRQCNNPPPQHGGKACVGVSTETTVCWVCPTEDWINASRACMALATVGAFLALFWSIVMNCSPSRHPICTGGALFLIALCAGMAGLIVYHSNIRDFPGCKISSGYSIAIGWVGVVVAAIGYIVVMIAMCQSGEMRVSSSDGVQMRTKTT